MKPGCLDCGMHYVGDCLEHKKYHDRIVNGIPAPPIKSDNVIWEDGDLRITVVDFRSSRAQKDRGDAVACSEHKDTKFNFRSYSAAEPMYEKDVHVFLFYKKKRAMGLMVVEKCDCVWISTWKNWDAGNKPIRLEEDPSMWSIGMIWILKRHRGNGFATTLFNKAIDYLGCDEKSIGWYAPPFTPSGEIFARKCCPDVFFVAK